MKEFFLFGILCVLESFSGIEKCAYIHEDPIKYYDEKTCMDLAYKKVNEMGTNLTSEGIQITQLKMNCIVDKSKQNT
jgi:hypothetical protein